MRSALVPCTVLATLLAAPAAAQSFNIDFGAASVLPGNGYGAAASQPGYWNGLWAYPPHATPLLDLAGAPTSVTMTDVNEFLDLLYDNPGTTGDDELIMDTFTYPFTGFGIYRIDGLQAGDYEVTTYAWAPDVATFRSGVAFPGSIDPLQVVGGPWPGGFVLGTTHAIHRVHVNAGASLTLNLSTVVEYASLNAMQVVRRETTTPYCFGDGSGTPCPCGNNGGPGAGCANSTGTGATLAGSGFPDVSTDQFALSVSGVPATTSVLFFQGDAQVNGGLGTVFGDGLRCAGGSVLRIGTKNASGGVAQYPQAGDVSISIRGALPAAGGTRHYQAWYRNVATFCTSDPFNLSSAVTAAWTP